MVWNTWPSREQRAILAEVRTKKTRCHCSVQECESQEYYEPSILSSMRAFKVSNACTAVMGTTRRRHPQPPALSFTSWTLQPHILNFRDSFSLLVQDLEAVCNLNVRLCGEMWARKQCRPTKKSLKSLKSSECDGVSVVWGQKWVEIQAVVMVSVNRAKRSLVITKLHIPGVAEF